MSKPVRRLTIAVALVVAISACSSTKESASPSTTSGVGVSTTASGAAFASIAAEVRGQTVNWYMYGGSDTINAFATGFVATTLKDKYGITLNQVKVGDTVEAVNKVLGEKQAGKTTDGSVDAIWINGENFASGKQADLWECGFVKDLPSAKNVDFANPNVVNDFGLPVEGCESPWQQANSALVYDSAKLGAADVSSMTSLFDWAKAHPGQLTYPAPPDFTGSMFVRTAFYDTNGGPKAFLGKFDAGKYQPAADKTWARLNDLKPSLWMKGTTYPQTQTEVAKLYAEGTVAAYLTYGPGLVGKEVDKGTYPKTTREAVFTDGNIGNISNIAVPKNAAHKAAGKVLAEVLLSPESQVEYFKEAGGFPAISADKAGPNFKRELDAVPVSPSVLPLGELTKNALPELEKAYVVKIEQDWKTNVLQK